MSPKSLLLSFAFASSLYATSTINTIHFDGNVKIPSKALSKVVHSYIGTPLDAAHASGAANDVEQYYRKHNYALAYAEVKEINTSSNAVTIKIGKYKDYNERSIGEMKRKPIVANTISQIYFEGNEKISINRLMNLVQPYLGKENTPANQQSITIAVRDYYRKSNFSLAYAEIAKNDNNVLTVKISKYKNFKELYAHEGKK